MFSELCAPVFFLCKLPSMSICHLVVNISWNCGTSSLMQNWGSVRVTIFELINYVQFSPSLRRGCLPIKNSKSSDISPINWVGGGICLKKFKRDFLKPFYSRDETYVQNWSATNQSNFSKTKYQTNLCDRPTKCLAEGFETWCLELGLDRPKSPNHRSDLRRSCWNFFHLWWDKSLELVWDRPKWQINLDLTRPNEVNCRGFLKLFSLMRRWNFGIAETPNQGKLQRIWKTFYSN